MVLPHGVGDLYHKYRPKRFSEIAGNKETVKSLKEAINSDHPSQVFLLTGDSGTGKTTSARIIALALNCDSLDNEGEPCLECKSCKVILSGSCVDIYEKNAADHRGIDAARELSSTMSLLPMQIRNKVYILDEFHQVTKEAQSSLLKVLEEAPKRVFIVLCTTHPEKILPTVKSRCQIFKFKNLPNSSMVNLLEQVCAYEGLALSKATLEIVANSSGGSPRAALVRLQQVMQLGSEDEAEIIKLLETEDAGGEDIFKFFNMYVSKTTLWSALMDVYSGMKEMGAPAIGMSLAGLIRNKLIAAKNWQDVTLYSNLLEDFLVPFDDGKLGENQLIAALARGHKQIKGSK